MAPPKESRVEPHIKRFRDGYRVWNPLSGTYNGDQDMAPFPGLDGASVRQREIIVEMADRGVGGAAIARKAEAIRSEQRGLFSVAPTRVAQGQMGFKFNGGRRSPSPGADLAAFTLDALRSPFVATHTLVYSDHTAPAMRVVDRAGREHFFARDAGEGGGTGAGEVVRVGRAHFLPEWGSDNPAYWRSTAHVKAQPLKKAKARKGNSYSMRGPEWADASFSLADRRRTFAFTHEVESRGYTISAMEVVDSVGRPHYFSQYAWDTDAGAGDVVLNRGVYYIPAAHSARPLHWMEDRSVRVRPLKANPGRRRTLSAAVERCVAHVGEKQIPKLGARAGLSSAIAICTAQAQRRGALRPGTRQLTAAGRRDNRNARRRVGFIEDERAVGVMARNARRAPKRRGRTAASKRRAVRR